MSALVHSDGREVKRTLTAEADVDAIAMAMAGIAPEDADAQPGAAMEVA